MPSVLDVFPYPWFTPQAQQLHVRLTQIHPTAQSALMIAQAAGIDIGLINSQQASAFVWKELLDSAATHGLLRALVEQVYNRLGPNSPQRLYLAQLLADKTPPLDAEPRGPYGAPRFLRDDDTVAEPEALLYHDDLTIQIGRLPALIATLQQLVTLAPAVCRLVVDVDGYTVYGTGFRIADDLLLTNWHVLHRRGDDMRATAVTAEFGYEDDGRGGALAPTLIPCNVATIVTSQADDWAVIRASAPLLPEWPAIRLSTAAEPVSGEPAYIVQHPDAQRKRIGFVRNQVAFFDDRVVHYLTDTQVGSSGSPVFDSQSRLIALHHAGGLPQEVLGRAPVKKNEGIRASRVLAGLQAQGIVVP